MTDDAGLNGPPTPPDRGERRRALKAERERPVDTLGGQVGPPGPPALVRPYARMTAPSTPLPVVHEPGSARPPSDQAAWSDRAASPDRAACNADQQGEADQEGVADREPARGEAEPSPRPHPAVDSGPVLHPPNGDPDVEDHRQDLADHRTDDQAEGMAAAPGGRGPENGPPPVPPEMAPPGWSAFTPVVPPGPLPFDADSPPFDPGAAPPEDSSERTSGRRPSFGRASAQRLTEALSRDASGRADPERADTVAPEGAGEAPEAGPGAQTSSAERAEPGDGPAPDEIAAGPEPDGETDDRSWDDEEPVRGTLAPVLRRSTQRARYPMKTRPLIRPPVLPPPPGEASGPSVPGGRVVTWDEALAGDVLPGTAGRRRGRPVSKARHESGGAGEYRPVAARDRSMTLLVVGMLLVLILLMGVAAWAFWPRLLGVR